MNLMRTFTKSFVLLAVLSMVLWTTGCAEQNSSVGANLGNTTPDTTTGDNDGDEEAGSAMGGDADREAGSSLGGGVKFPDSGSSSDVPGAETETKKE